MKKIVLTYCYKTNTMPLKTKNGIFAYTPLWPEALDMYIFDAFRQSANHIR